MLHDSRTILEVVQSLPLDHRSADRLHAVALAGQLARQFEPSLCGARIEIFLTSPCAGTSWWDVAVVAPDTAAGRALIHRLRATQPLRLDADAVRVLACLRIAEARQMDRCPLPAFARAA